MKRAIVLALTTLCALALVAVPAQAAGGKAKKAQRPGRSGVCVVVVKQTETRRTAPQGRGGRRSPRCRGPRGPRGSAGPRGADGKDGANGTNGTNGTNGRDGATGPAGPKGDKGDKGDPGTPAGGGTRYAIVRAAGTTRSATFEPLATPGPSVTVTVPESGTIQVVASAVGSLDEGAVSLFEDGVQLAGQADFCDGPAGTLFDTLGDFGPINGATYGTPGSISFAGVCATVGAPGAVLFQTTPGRHTYELRYALSTCGCAPVEAGFSDRRLWVTPLA